MWHASLGAGRGRGSLCVGGIARPSVKLGVCVCVAAVPSLLAHAHAHWHTPMALVSRTSVGAGVGVGGCAVCCLSPACISAECVQASQSTSLSACVGGCWLLACVSACLWD